jgi:uncharacterized protein (TIGR02145 family)
VNVNHGTTQTFTITPATGYHVSDVLVDGVSAGAVVSYTFSNVTANHSINASFAEGVSTVTSAGQIWMDRNLGASRAASSSTDIEAYGDLYQWGRGTDGHEKRNSSTTSNLSTANSPGHGQFITNSISPYDWKTAQNDNLWQGVSGINNPCPAGFRLPTETEFRTENISWSSNDSAGAFSSPTKFVMAGYRIYSNGIISSAAYGGYWSSTLHISNARYMYFGENEYSGGIGDNYRAEGFSIRCIKD